MSVLSGRFQKHNKGRFDNANIAFDMKLPLFTKTKAAAQLHVFVASVDWFIHRWKYLIILGYELFISANFYLAIKY